MRKLDAIHKDGCVSIVNTAQKEIINYVPKTQVYMMITILVDIQHTFNLLKEWFSEFQRDSMTHWDHHYYVLVLQCMPHSRDSTNQISHVQSLVLVDWDTWQYNMLLNWVWQSLHSQPVQIERLKSKDLVHTNYQVQLIKKHLKLNLENMTLLSIHCILRMRKSSKPIKDWLLQQVHIFKLVLPLQKLTLN